MPLLEGSPVDHRFASQTVTHGTLQLAPEPQYAVHIVSVFNTHLVNLHQHVLEAGQSHITGVFIVVFPGTRHRTVVQKIGRLPAQTAQGALKMADPRLEGRQHRG